MSIDQYHIEYGRHSNIPDCCIAFFIGPWQDMYTQRELHRLPHVGYVPCPECRQNESYVTVHHCAGKPCWNLNTLIWEKYKEAL